jgi:hypothetical protein
VIETGRGDGATNSFVSSPDMSIATEKRQFYDGEIRVAARPRYAHVERRCWLAICGSMTKRFPGFARNRIVRQFKASAAYGANATAQTGA